MRIKLTTTQLIGRRSYRPGDTPDVHEDHAVALIQAGHATPVVQDDSQLETATDPEADQVETRTKAKKTTRRRRQNKGS